MMGASSNREGRRTDSSELSRKREEAMRPSRFIGYDHNRIGLHLMQIESYDLARNELERAVWLNPYEPKFVLNLCYCLYRSRQYPEARVYLKRLSEFSAMNDECERLSALIDEAERYYREKRGI
jgi:Flp pilus assembly protein TadD